MQRRGSVSGSSMSGSLFICILVGAALVPSIAVGLPMKLGGWAAKFANGKPNVVAEAGPSSGDIPHGIEGTWRVVGVFSGGNMDSALFSFAAGRDGLGVVTHTDNFYFTASPSCLPGQGVWKKSGDQYISTDEAFCFDTFNDFAPAGTLRFQSAITLTNHFAQFTGQTHLLAFDPDGNLVFEDTATLFGQRMAVVGP